MRILVVDDEPPARQRLIGLVQELSPGEEIGEASSGVQALERVGADAPEVVLLDIRMPGMDGLEVARHLARLDRPPAVIFTTAYDSHALAAFEVQAVDYLLKPVRRERLAEALGRARKLSRAQVEGLGSAGGGARTHVSATMHGNLLLVPVDQVRFFLADQKYVTVGSADGEVLIEESLKDLEQEFGERFLRIHRNALVAVQYVQALERDADGCCTIRLAGVTQRLAVSRRMLTVVRSRLK